MQAQPQYRDDVKNMRFFFVRSNNGEMVPLDSLVTVEPEMTVPSITRFNGASAFKIAGSPADGYSTGQAMAALEEVAHEVLPTTYSRPPTPMNGPTRAVTNGKPATRLTVCMRFLWSLYSWCCVPCTKAGPFPLRYCCRFPRRLWAAWVPSSCEASRMIFICRLP